MSINPIGHYSLTNPASVYDEESLTALELAARCAGKVNEVVNEVNKHTETVQKEQAAQNQRMDGLQRQLTDSIPASIAAWLETHPESKFDQFITPQMFGAKGDGLTDDSAALEAAFAAADRIVIPSGTYLISRNIFIPSGKTVEGTPGAVITGFTFMRTFVCLQGNSVLRGVSLKCAGVDVYGTGNLVENCVSSDADSTAFMVRCDTLEPTRCNTFRNCVAQHSKGHGFNIGTNSNVSSNSRAGAIVDNILYDNCLAINSGSSTGGGWGCGFCIHCTESNLGAVTYNGCTAISPYESGFHVEYDVSRRSITFINCHATSAGKRKPDAEYGAGFFLHPAHSFTGCTVEGCKVLTYLPSDTGLRFTPADYERFDIYCTDNGMNLKDVVCRVSGGAAFSLKWAKAFMGSTFSNATNRPFFNPLYFHRDDAPCGCKLENGRLVFDKTLDSAKQNTVCLPLFGVIPGYNFTVYVSGKPGTWQEDPTFVKAYLCFFDAELNTLSSLDGQGAWTDTETNTINITTTSVPSNAAYAAVVINPAYATNSAAQTYNAPIIENIAVKGM